MNVERYSRLSEKQRDEVQNYFAHRIVIRSSNAQRNQEIYLARNAGEKVKDIAARYNLSRPYVSMILRGYEIYLLENELPDLSKCLPGDELASAAKSPMAKAKKAIKAIGKKRFYSEYNIISALPMSTRCKNAMQNASIFTLHQLDTKTNANLLDLPNFSKVSLKELRIAVDHAKTELGVRELSDTVIKQAEKSLTNLFQKVGEDRAREIVKSTFDLLCEKKLRKDLKEVLMTIAPEKSPFEGRGLLGNPNFYEWKTK